MINLRPFSGAARTAGACAEKPSKCVFKIQNKRTDLSHLEFDASNGLPICNSKIRCKRRVSHNGRQCVAVLVCHPFARVQTKLDEVSASENHSADYLDKSACPARDLSCVAVHVKQLTCARIACMHCWGTP
jgi:hypothetical protein